MLLPIAIVNFIYSSILTIAVYYTHLFEETFVLTLRVLVRKLKKTNFFYKALQVVV